MSTLGITTFLRIDQQIMDDVLPHLVAVIPHNELHCHWLFILKNLNTELGNWLMAQSDEAIGLGSINEETMELQNVANPKYVVVGISYSTLTADMLTKLAMRVNTRMTDVHAFKYLNYAVKTRNPLIMWNRERKQYYYESENPVYAKFKTVSNLTELELQFVESLAGHDFFYEYSDSLTAYKAGKHREANLKAAGVAMGLSQNRVEILYNAEYKRLTNR